MRGEYKSDIEKIAVIKGCDLVTAAAEFVARNGLIYAIMSNADASKIASYRMQNSTVQITTDTWIAQEINDNKIVWFREPVESITPSAGSFWVYYC